MRELGSPHRFSYGCGLNRSLCHEQKYTFCDDRLIANSEHPQETGDPFVTEKGGWRVPKGKCVENVEELQIQVERAREDEVEEVNAAVSVLSTSERHGEYFRI